MDDALYIFVDAFGVKKDPVQHIATTIHVSSSPSPSLFIMMFLKELQVNEEVRVKKPGKVRRIADGIGP